MDKDRLKAELAVFLRKPYGAPLTAAIIVHLILFLLFGARVVLRAVGRGELFRVRLVAPMIAPEPGGGQPGGGEKTPTEIAKPLAQRATEAPEIEQNPALVDKDVVEEVLRVERPTASVAASKRAMVSAASLVPKTVRTGTGLGRGPGSIYAGRGQRGAFAKRYGGTGASESAVDRGLAFLARHQNEDGSWDSGYGKTSGVTGLCLLAFLGAGHRGVREDPYATVIDRAVRFIMDTGTESVFINTKIQPGDSGQMYSHCMATLALCEAYTVGGVKRARSPARAGIETILAAQAVSKQDANLKGGWRYTTSSPDSDLSCTGWAVMALISGRHAGLDVPWFALKEAAEYVKRSGTGDGFSYQPGAASSPAMTGSGALSLQFCGYGDEESVARAIRTMKANRPAKGQTPNYYYWYYATQAMFQKGGLDWQYWNNSMRDVLVESQKGDGHWDPGAGTGEAQAGVYYSTALAILCLEVYYRYLPIFTEVEVVPEAMKETPAPAGEGAQE